METLQTKVSAPLHLRTKHAPSPNSSLRETRRRRSHLKEFSACHVPLPPVTLATHHGSAVPTPSVVKRTQDSTVDSITCLCGSLTCIACAQQIAPLISPPKYSMLCSDLGISFQPSPPQQPAAHVIPKTTTARPTKSVAMASAIRGTDTCLRSSNLQHPNPRVRRKNFLRQYPQIVLIIPIPFSPVQADPDGREAVSLRHMAHRPESRLRCLPRSLAERVPGVVAHRHPREEDREDPGVVEGV